MQRDTGTFESRQPQSAALGGQDLPTTASTETLESDIQVVSYSPNRGLKIILLLLAIWNVGLTWWAIEHATAIGRNAIFSLGDGTATLQGRDLEIPGNLRVSGNVLVTSAATTGVLGTGNVIIGDDHQFDLARNSLIVGQDNRINGIGSSVLSGRQNVVTVNYGTVVGGHFNFVSGGGSRATISGGQNNQASGRASVIAGGTGNNLPVENGFLAPPNTKPLPS